MKLQSHRKEGLTLLLLFLFFVAVFLRSYKISDNLFFGPEQGIDFLAIKEIAFEHNLTLIGPKTDVSGVFHGPLYYYLGTIPFLFSKGNPVVIALFFILLHSLAVFLVYKIGKDFFNSTVGLMAAGLFTVSFGTIVYSHWLSNTPPSLYLSGLFFLFLHRFLKGDAKSIYPAAFFFGLTGQSEFLHFLFYSVIVCIVILLFRKRFISLKKKQLFLSLLILIMTSFSTYVLFDLKHNFLITQSLIKLMTKQTGFHMGFADAASQTFHYFSTQVASFILPFRPLTSLFVLAIAITCLIPSLLQKHVGATLLLLWLFTPLCLLLLLKHAALDQFFVTIGFPCILASSFMIFLLFKKNRYAGFAVFFSFVLMHLFTWYNNIPQNRNMFFQSPQPLLRLSDQKTVIDEIYRRSGIETFSIQAFTIPYWMQQGWEYLFWYYGTAEHQGNLPQASGAGTLFVIIQKSPFNPSESEYQKTWLKNEVSHWGVKQDEFTSGILTVQQLKTR